MSCEITSSSRTPARASFSPSRNTSSIGRLANNAPLSLKAMKALTVRQLELRDHIKHDDIDALVVAAMQSQDAQEGMKARLEKRTAKFQGK